MLIMHALKSCTLPLYAKSSCKKDTNRLCLRGDQQSLINSGFVSAQTAPREFLRWVVILKVNNNDFDMGLIDICQAFLQSSYLRKSERVIARVPPYVKFHQGLNDENSRNGFAATGHLAEVFEDESKKTCRANQIDTENSYGIKLYRPIYGSRDAHLRWF